jgi:glycosyltransferase involved in cell wall biosynthesis
VARAKAGGASALWGLNGASLELFRWAQATRVKCVLEQVVAPARTLDRLLSAEQQRWPAARAVPARDPEGAFARREEEEWALASRVVSCSPFVSQELVKCGVSEKKIRLVPFGVDLDRFTPRPAPASWPPNRPLRVLFLGEVGLRKGAPYLLEALERLGGRNVEARLVGSISLEASFVRRFSSVVSVLGAIPRSDLAPHWHWADVLALPSLCEGSALVTYEALASGLPVVTTVNAGSLVRDGVDGAIVPIRDSKALARALVCYATEDGLLMAHRNAALAGRERVSFERYRRDLLAALDGL